jgi:hypothetical protein
MEQFFFIAAIVTFMYTVMKVLVMKYFEKQMVPLKYIIRDATMVFAASFVGLFGFFKMNGSLNDFLNVVTDGKAPNMKGTQIFTDEPGF